MPRSAIRSQRIVLIEADRIGWAASGRNGGFVDASLTHGRENGKSRWPNDIDQLTEMGLENLDGMQDEIERLGLDVEWQRTGMLAVATEPHQVEWLRGGGGAGHGQLPRPRGRASEVAFADVPGRAVRARHVRDRASRPSWRSNSPARAQEAGVRIYEHTNATSLDSGGGGPARRRRWRHRDREAGRARDQRLHLACCGATGFTPCPVYDYVLATEPLSDAQLDRIGWQSRQGIGDSANQFHYYRMTVDNRIVWGGYDAIYHFGRKVDAAYEDRHATVPQARRALLHHLPATRGRPVQPPVGGRHRHQHPVLCALGPGPRRPGRLRQRLHRARRRPPPGLPPTCASTCSTGAHTPRTELEMVRKRPLPFPPEPFASIGIQATRWSLDRADHTEGRRNALLRTLDALGLGFDS